MRISDWSSDVCSSDLGEKNGHAYVEHNGEAVGFLSENIVFPDDKAAVVVFVNSDLSNAFLTITQGIVKTAFPAIANAATGTDETVKTAEARRSEEHTSELQSLMRISYAVFCLKKKNQIH